MKRISKDHVRKIAGGFIPPHNRLAGAISAWKYTAYVEDCKKEIAANQNLILPPGQIRPVVIIFPFSTWQILIER